jgi:hypothetical protein
MVCGAGNGIEAKGAVALAAALQGNTTLRTLDLRRMWTARTRAFGGNGRPLRGPRECAGGEARASCCVSARRGRVRASEHGVVRGAVNGIKAEGAVALAAALQGNTTLQTLNLYSMWTACCVCFALREWGGRSGDLASARAERHERLVVVVGAAQYEGCANVPIL